MQLVIFSSDLLARLDMPESVQVICVALVVVKQVTDSKGLIVFSSTALTHGVSNWLQREEI